MPVRLRLTVVKPSLSSDLLFGSGEGFVDMEESQSEVVIASCVLLSVRRSALKGWRRGGEGSGESGSEEDAVLGLRFLGFFLGLIFAG